LFFNTKSNSTHGKSHYSNEETKLTVISRKTLLIGSNVTEKQITISKIYVKPQVDDFFLKAESGTVLNQEIKAIRLSVFHLPPFFPPILFFA
jgi:hypothetical protein